MAMEHPRIQDPLYHFDTHFPERFSQLKLNPEFSASPRRGRKGTKVRMRNNSRYRTQPITFDEIKEVDEENEAADKEENKENNVDGVKARDSTKAHEGLLNTLAAFSQSCDMACFPSTKAKPDDNATAIESATEMSKEQKTKVAMEAAEEIHKNRSRRKEKKKNNKDNDKKERKMST